MQNWMKKVLITVYHHNVITLVGIQFVTLPGRCLLTLVLANAVLLLQMIQCHVVVYASQNELNVPNIDFSRILISKDQ